METQKLKEEYLIPPETLWDKNDYPTKEYLDFLRNYKPSDKFTIDEFVRLIENIGWWIPDYLTVVSYTKGKIEYFELHTGGYTSNENIILALLANEYLLKHHIRLYRHNAGGHFYFKIERKEQ